MKITQSDFNGRLMNAMRLQNDPIWQLALTLQDMGITREELNKLCNNAKLIPDPITNRLQNIFLDIDKTL